MTRQALSAWGLVALTRGLGIAVVCILLSGSSCQAQAAPLPAADGPVIHIAAATPLINVIRRLASEGKYVVAGGVSDATVLQKNIPAGAYTLKALWELIGASLGADERRETAGKITLHSSIPLPQYKFKVPQTLVWYLTDNGRFATFLELMSPAEWTDFSQHGHEISLASLKGEQQSLVKDILLRPYNFKVNNVSLVDMPPDGFTVSLSCQPLMNIQEPNGKTLVVVLEDRK